MHKILYSRFWLQSIVSYLITPLSPTSESELLSNRTSVPVGASSGMVVWKDTELNDGILSFTSPTSTITVPELLRDGLPTNTGEKQAHLYMHLRVLTQKQQCVAHIHL